MKEEGGGGGNKAGRKRGSAARYSVFDEGENSTSYLRIMMFVMSLPSSDNSFSGDSSYEHFLGCG